MGSFSTENIRNIAVLGHGGEGKTSLCEAILFNTKMIDRLGKTMDGTTTMDFDELEIQRQISISLSVAYATYRNTKINLIDVPGYFDFAGETASALTAADSAVVVMSALGEVSVGADKAVEACSAKQLPLLFFLNQIDKENADYGNTIDALQKAYPGKIVPLMFPIFEGGKSVGYADVLSGKGYSYGKKEEAKEIAVPSDIAAKVKEIADGLVEIAAENDDDLLEKFFGGETLSTEEIVVGLNKGIAAAKCYPVLCGCASMNIGVFNLLDKIVDLLPSPAGKKVVATKGGEGGDLVEVKIDKNGPFACQIFKTIADPFVGKLNIFKVISGSAKSGLNVINTTKDGKERINALMYIRGKKQENSDEIVAGDIGAFTKLSNTSTGDTLCDPSLGVVFPAIEFPRPVLSLAISSAKKGEDDKVFDGLRKLTDEDASFTVTKNAETNEMLINGQGEAQLEVICKKLKNKFGCDAVLKDPKISYREAIRGRAEAEGKHKKQSGGAGQFGVVNIRFEPGAADGVFEFVDAVVGGAVPKNFIPAVEKGLREAIKKGVLAGCPMVDLKATLFDGKSHPVDSKEVAFVSAAKLAYDEALTKAKPVLLEPIMKAQIVVPESYMGDILGDMNKRRGRILGMDSAPGGKQVINAEVPMAEMFKYATDLRGMTQGRGSFSMEIERYEEVPGAIVQKVIAEIKKDAEE